MAIYNSCIISTLLYDSEVSMDYLNIKQEAQAEQAFT